VECVFLQPNTKLLCTHTKGKMAEITRKLNSHEGKPNNRGEEATTGSHHGPWHPPRAARGGGCPGCSLFRVVASSFAIPNLWYFL